MTTSKTKGAPTLPSAPDSSSTEADQYQLTAAEMRLIQLYRCGDVDRQEFATEFLEGFLGREPAMKPTLH